MSDATTQQDDTVALVQFHLFPKLPQELRLKVWIMAVEPRIVEIHIKTNLAGESSHEFLNPIPAVLHASSESRIECLKYYELSSRGSEESPLENCQNPLNCFYFNSEIDILYMPCEDYSGNRSGGWWSGGFFEKNDCGILDKVQRVAIESARDYEITVNYFSRNHTPQTIVLVDVIPCSPRYDCLNQCRGPRCLMTFNELKSTLKDEKGKKISWVDMERIGMLRRERAFKSKWKSNFGDDVPCPEIQSRVLCRAKCHNTRPAHWAIRRCFSCVT